MIRLENISKTFYTTDNDVEALKNVSLTINDGDIYGIIGVSGAGKSTLVRCINMLEKPTEGTIYIDDVDMMTLSDKELRTKRKEISMIFQSFNLLNQKNCLQNVCFPLELEKVPKDQAKKRAMELLERVGLADKATSYPSQLSGGQKQRVAIARALATDPKVLLCDEATSALDPTTTNSILDLIRDINKELGITVVMITHQMSVVESVCNHVAILDNGIVAETGNVDEVFSHPKSLAAKRLVFPEGSLDVISQARPDEHLVRLVFDGSESTNTPLIARMAVEKGIQANITFASTKSIGGKTYGYMLLGIDGDEETLKVALDYLGDNDHTVAEEVVVDE